MVKIERLQKPACALNFTLSKIFVLLAPEGSFYLVIGTHEWLFRLNNQNMVFRESLFYYDCTNVRIVFDLWDLWFVDRFIVAHKIILKHGFSRKPILLCMNIMYIVYEYYNSF